MYSPGGLHRRAWVCLELASALVLMPPDVTGRSRSEVSESPGMEEAVCAKTDVWHHCSCDTNLKWNGRFWSCLCIIEELHPFLPEEDCKTTPTLRQKAPRRGLAKESAAHWNQGAWCCGLRLRKGIITLQGFDQKTLGSHLCLKFGGN